jgi:flagellar motor switch protein FliG
VLKEIEEALEASLRDILGGNQDVGGPGVVADILNLTGSSVEKNVLDQMDAQDPEVADEELKDEILGNMSERVRTFISEEMEFLGPMRLSEVEEVQLRIVQQVRQLEEQG